MPSEPYEVKLLRFYYAGYRHFGDCNVAPSLLTSDTAYTNRLIEPSEPYDVKQLWSTPEPVFTMLWMMPRNFDHRPASACTATSAPLTKPGSLIPHYPLLSNTATTLPMPLCAVVLMLPLQV